MAGALAVNPTPGFAERQSGWPARALLTPCAQLNVLLPKNVAFSNTPSTYKPSSAEQIWALLDVPVILGAWECSWGLASCPRHGVTVEVKEGRVDLLPPEAAGRGSEGTISLIRCASPKHSPRPRH